LWLNLKTATHSIEQVIDVSFFVNFSVADGNTVAQPQYLCKWDSISVTLT